MMHHVAAKYFGLLFGAFVSGQVLAQTFVVSGRMVDGKSPVEFVNVSAFQLPDTTKPVAFATSDASGFFSLSVSKFPVLLTARLVGYAAVNFRVDKAKADSFYVGEVQIKPARAELSNVVVTARKKMIVKTPTGLVVRADESITQAAGTVADLLAATPTVLVDAEGTISMRGKSPMVLVNGRNSVLGAAALGKIPASSIDRIEITNMPSASNDAEGEAGIINIVFKKNTKQGTTGAFSASGGAGYGGRFSSSFLLNKSTKTWDFGLGYDNRFSNRIRDIAAERITYASIDKQYLTQNRHDTRTEQTHNLRLEAERKFDDNTSLTFEAIYEYDKERNYETLYSTFLDKDQKFTTGNVRISDENQRDNAVELAATFLKTYGSKGKKTLASLSHSFQNEFQQTGIATTATNAEGKPFGDEYLQRTSNLEKKHVGNFRLDNTVPINAQNLLEWGYKGVFRWLNSDFKNGPESNGTWTPNPIASNVFNFNEQINAAYAQFKRSPDDIKRGSVAWEAGLRLEYTTNKGANGNNTQRFTNNYLNAFPTAAFTTYLSKDQWFRLSYARRINRPGLGSLNPFVDVTDSLSPRGGNPFLQPELIHSVDLGYNYQWKKGSAGLNLYHRNGTNTSLPFTTIDSNAVAFTRPENFGQSITTGVEFVGSAAPGKVVNFVGSFSLYHQQINGEKEGVSISTAQWTWYAKLTANLKLWRGSNWQWLFDYQAPTAIPQGTRIAQYNIDMGLAQTCLRGKGRLGLTITDMFNMRKSGIELSTPEFRSLRTSKADTRALLITFGYSFGSSFKEKVMKNQFNLE
jgi:outer membrane cobalamin receptor